jgi:hypothetical protein
MRSLRSYVSILTAAAPSFNRRNARGCMHAYAPKLDITLTTGKPEQGRSLPR